MGYWAMNRRFFVFFFTSFNCCIKSITVCESCTCMIYVAFSAFSSLRPFAVEIGKVQIYNHDIYINMIIHHVP